MRLPAAEFIRRFLQHVLPEGYVRIRHYGLLASRGRERKLAKCRELLEVAGRKREGRQETSEELALRMTGRDLRQCERCGKGEMVKVEEWEFGESPPVRLWQAKRKAA
jgi:predicted metal-dependent hydrolase